MHLAKPEPIARQPESPRNRHGEIAWVRCFLAVPITEPALAATQRRACPRLAKPPCADRWGPPRFHPALIQGRSASGQVVGCAAWLWRLPLVTFADANGTGAATEWHAEPEPLMSDHSRMRSSKH